MISILMQKDFGALLAYLVASLTVVFLATPIHEFAHAWTANRMGDPTPRYQGRLTLNPIAHIDYLGALLIVLFGFGWAKPVPVDPRNFRDPRSGMAVTAAAGPIANLCLAFLSLLLLQGTLLGLYRAALGSTLFEVLRYVCSFFSFLASINIRLCVFNLIPVPPLDGSRILGLFLSNRSYYKFMQYERQLSFLVILLLAVGVLSYPLSYAADGIYTALYNLTGLPFRLFQ